MAHTKINTQVIPDGTIVSADLSMPITGFSSTGIDDNATSTVLTVTDSGVAATLTTATQSNITSVGTLTGFTSTGIDDNATSTQLTITDSEITATPTLTATTALKLGDWEIKLDSTDLKFVYNGTDVFRITTAGQLIALDDVTAYGTP